MSQSNNIPLTPPPTHPPTHRSFSVLEVQRSEEFSPVKNAPGAAKDTPETARADLLRLHHKLVLSNGGRVVDRQGREL